MGWGEENTFMNENHALLCWGAIFSSEHFWDIVLTESLDNYSEERIQQGKYSEEEEKEKERN